MHFDLNTFGSVPSSACSLNAAICFGGPFDAEKHFGMIRKADVLSTIERIAVMHPTQAQLDFAAAILVFTAFGLTRSQSQARAQLNKYIVQWSNSASDIFDRGPDQTWNVPIGLVVFQREW